MDMVSILLRWLHIVPAVAGGGATVFAAIALVPTLGELPAAERSQIRDTVMRRWRPVFTACVALLLASGLLNFMLFQAPVHKGQPLYHGLFGLKFILAMAVFFLGSALTGRSATFQKLRDRTSYWTAVNALLIVTIVLISGVLRGIPKN
jgi:putative copper export protein